MPGRGRTAGRAAPWTDLLIVAGLAGILFAAFRVTGEWTAPFRPAVEMDLSPLALPKYTLFSLARGLVAYVFSLLFAVLYGTWAARDDRAERVLLPLLDVLQSIPVLGFLPGVVLGLVAIFPGSNVGLELASVLMIFTGQVWNMAFSFYSSLRAIPPELLEAASVYHFGPWQRFRWVELPAATMGLVWNSMLSMAGGWFFLMVSEAFVLGDRDFRLPGIGSYMSVAAAKGDTGAMAWAVLAMVVMITALDQLLWRPTMAWAQKFRSEEVAGTESYGSWFLDRLRRSMLLARARRAIHRWRRRRRSRARPAPPRAPGTGPAPVPRGRALSTAALVVLVLAMGFGVVELVRLLSGVGPREWGGIAEGALWTLGRVVLATALGTLWAVPVGLAVGLSPRLSRILQPVIQVLASFPAPMLFPVLVAALRAGGVPLGWGSVVLMLLGTQWYILFNVIAGAMAIPGDLREMARSFRFGRMRRFTGLYLPAVFPHLVTGWITAAGGAWNASIVAEYVTWHGEVVTAHGLGSEITRAAESADFPRLAAAVVVMSAFVVLFNRLVWKRLYALAEDRFSLSR